MDERKLGAVETRFADLIWENQPLSSGVLVRICEQELGWKKSTTYTVLKKLCQRGIFRNEGGEVTALISREEAQTSRVEELVEQTFGGSIPAFIAAFGRSGKLSREEAAQLRAMIDAMED